MPTRSTNSINSLNQQKQKEIITSFPHFFELLLAGQESECLHSYKEAETLQSANETKNEQKDAYKNINTNVFYFPDQGMGAVYFNKGENCIAAGRLFVEESIHDEFVRKVVRQLKTEV